MESIRLQILYLLFIIDKSVMHSAGANQANFNISRPCDCPQSSRMLEMSAATSLFFDQLHLTDHHFPIDGFAHIVNS